MSVGSAAKGERESAEEHEHLEALKAALIRLPKVHLSVLDAIVLHLKGLVLQFSISYVVLTASLRLIDNTEVEETDEVYLTKLALSVGRSEFLLSLIYCMSAEDCASHSPPQGRDKRISPRPSPSNVLRGSRQPLCRHPPSNDCQKES